MLRRPATTIKLTPEDVLEYDDTLAHQQAQQVQQSLQQQQQQQQQSYSHDQILQEQINTSSGDIAPTFKPTVPLNHPHAGYGVELNYYLQ
ncbi:anaphase-promoting complex, subunit CDC26 [Scheffersomyces xylosifermentans]|uniref:anaphase-promoting complex, subunit CDC26 n=1 Tax=Scheffersomyces xylosifermentans TaxID=1304137 RepID=UPI00315C702B